MQTNRRTLIFGFQLATLIFYVFILQFGPWTDAVFELGNSNMLYWRNSLSRIKVNTDCSVSGEDEVFFLTCKYMFKQLQGTISEVTDRICLAKNIPSGPDIQHLIPQTCFSLRLLSQRCLLIIILLSLGALSLLVSVVFTYWARKKHKYLRKAGFALLPCISLTFAVLSAYPFFVHTIPGSIFDEIKPMPKTVSQELPFIAFRWTRLGVSYALTGAIGVAIVILYVIISYIQIRRRPEEIQLLTPNEIEEPRRRNQSFESIPIWAFVENDQRGHSR